MVESLHAAIGETKWQGGQETQEGSLENINMEQHTTWQFPLLVHIQYYWNVDLQEKVSLLCSLQHDLQ